MNKLEITYTSHPNDDLYAEITYSPVKSPYMGDLIATVLYNRERKGYDLEFTEEASRQVVDLTSFQEILSKIKTGLPESLFNADEN